MKDEKNGKKCLKSERKISSKNAKQKRKYGKVKNKDGRKILTVASGKVK